MHYMEYRVPSALEQIQRILAIPAKKTDTRLVRHLTAHEMQSILDAPDPTVLIHGKGRKERCLPLWKETASAVRAWLSVRGEVRVPELFPNARNDAMTRAGFEYILRKHVRTAETRCPTLSSKHVSPHVLSSTLSITQHRTLHGTGQSKGREEFSR
jgi:integrase/recombinase XerD